MPQLRTPPIFSYDAHATPLSHYLRSPIPTVPSTFSGSPAIHFTTLSKARCGATFNHYDFSYRYRYKAESIYLTPLSLGGMILLGDLELGFLISVYGLLFGLWVARSKRLRAVFPNSCLWVLTGVMSREDLVYCLTFWNYGDLRDHRPLSCRYYCLRDTHHYCSMHVGIKTIFNVGPCFPT